MSEDSIDIGSTPISPTDSSTSSNIAVTIVQEIINIPIIFVLIYCYWICFLLSYACYEKSWGHCVNPHYGFNNNYSWYLPPFIFTAIIIWVGYELNLGIWVGLILASPIFLFMIWQYSKMYTILQSRTISSNVVHE